MATDDLDMTQFEAQFGDRLYSDHIGNEDFERLAHLQDLINDLGGVIEHRSLLNKALELKAEAINKIIRRIDKLLARYREKRRAFDDAIHANRRDNRKAQELLSSAERELKRLQDEIASRLRLQAQRRQLDKNTADLPWRDKALPHQIEGAHTLVSAERAILGDKPGLGKTLQAIMTIDLLRAQGKGKKVLIFTPKPVLADFERAFKQWTNPTFVHVLNQTLKGIKVEMLDMLAHWPEAIVLTNYEVWRKDASIKDSLAKCGFDTIILDEAHILKGFKSVTTKGIREIVYAENQCPKCGGMNLGDQGLAGKFCLSCEYVQEEFNDFCSIKRVIPMTGTPILNKPQDLFALLNLIDRQGFPTENSFLQDYCQKQYDYVNDRYFWTFGPGGSERLLKKLGMKYTARTRDSAGVKMPPQEIKHHYLELDPEKYPRQKRFIELLRDKARIAFSDDHQMTTQAVLAWYTRMRQAASWPDGIQINGCGHSPLCEDEYGIPNVAACYNQTTIFPPPDAPPVGESVIMDQAETIIREAVESGERIVVFSMFKAVLKELEKRCNTYNISAARFDGDTPQKNRQGIIDDFNGNITKKGEHRFDVMLCQYQTASVGLNLHGAQQLLCVEREWNPGKEEQTIDRLRRIDSQYESIVHILHCAGTATDLIDAIQEQKKAMLDDYESEANLLQAMRDFLKGDG